MKNKIYEKTDKLIFKFETISNPMLRMGLFLAFMTVLNACSKDASFKLKEGADSLQSVNQIRRNPSFLINNGFEYTDDPMVNLSFNPDGEANEMFISLDSDCSTGSWEPFKENKPWELTRLNQNTTIYVKYKYKFFESECIQDGIVHDNIPPVLEFTQNFETLWIDNKDLNISFQAEDSGSGVKSIHCDLSGSGEFRPCNETLSLNSMEENHNYQLVVQVQDKAENSVTKSLNWRSDQTSPEIVFNSGPGAVTNNSNPRFSFTASDSGSGVADYWCRLDDKPQFEKCRNKITFKNLNDGPHRLEVKAMDKVGRTSNVISHAWTQDRNAPTINFTDKPFAITKSSEALFGFTGINNQEEVVSYRCRLDSGSYKNCSSPQSLKGLSDGRHRFSVIGSDKAENKSSPITYRWRIDTASPTIAFSEKPKPMSSSSEAFFSFQSQDRGSGVKDFQCHLDNEPKPCNNFLRLTKLSEGTHTFLIKATDHAGNPSNIIQHQWLIDKSKPTVTLISRPDPYFNSDQAQFVFNVSDQISGIDKTECRLDGGSFQTCKSPVDYSQLSEGGHSFSIKVRDKAGNVSSTQSYQWFIDTKGPEIVFMRKPDNLAYIGSDVKIQFTVSDNKGVGIESHQCLLNNQPQPCIPDTLYRLPVTHYGDNTFQIIAFDKLGNSTTETLNWTNRDELVERQKIFKVEMDRPVDVLFVVDNSKSMNKEREDLAGKIDGFLHKLEGLDWQVAVISTEIHDRKDSDKYYQDGRLLPFDAEDEVHILDPTIDVDMAQALFADRVTTIPVDTTGNEQGIYATVRTIERALDGQGENAANARFFRENAHLAVIVLSDEDENSEGKDVRYSPSQFLFFVQESLGREKQITWHSIVIMSGDEGCKEADKTEKHDFYGARYEELSGLTGHGQPGGAIIGSICAEDYTTMLEDIGQSVKDKHNTVPLECQPSTGDGDDEQAEVLVTHKAADSTDYEPYLGSHVLQNQEVVFDDLMEPGDYIFNFGCKK